MSSFVHLHTHSNYSLREGAAKVGELAGRAAALGMESLALTDHDGMYGAVRFTTACQEAGIRPILGAEIEWGDGYHAVLLTKDSTGWSNLCHLVTSMHLSERAQSLPPGRRPRTSFNEIAEHSEGLFALSGCDKGEVNHLAALGLAEEAEQAARRWIDVFDTDSYALEISNHLQENDGSRINRLLELSKKIGVSPVATNNVHYTQPSDAVVHEVLDAIRRIVPLTRANNSRANAEFDMKSPQQMRDLLPKQAVEATAKIADICRYELPLGEFHFPQPDFAGSSPTSVLARRCWMGIKSRYLKVTRAIEDRLQTELKMIRRGGFCGYFLLVADIVEYSKKTLDIRCACRGSAAGSLVAYALFISDVDPIRHGLVFERFMNEHRHEIPDIDIDFPSHRREEVLNYILSTYPGRTAMVAMMETFRARGALREVGKALGFAASELDAVAEAFPHISAGAIHGALESLPELSGVDLKASRFEVLFDLASRLDTYPRHLALHPSAVVLSDERLADLMPMQRSFQGFLVSQYDKDDVEVLGLAKLDVLGVRMLSSMNHALEEIERIRGVKVDLDEASLEDAKSWELMRSSRTLGCFQIESPGQRELLGKFQPERFEDLIIEISLFRPGPMKADMIKPFLNRRMELEPVTYEHPSLAPILRETNGVIVYHEQVMRVIVALTGCTLSDADKIRRSLGGGLGDHMTIPEAPDPELRHWIVAKALQRGWKKTSVEKVWGEVAQFASFGFCKAHAAAFAVPTYLSAWLKANYPAEFYSGLLTHDPGMYPRRALLADARAHDVRILEVDVNASWPDYRAEPIQTDRSPPASPAPIQTCATPGGFQPPPIPSGDRGVVPPGDRGVVPPGDRGIRPPGVRLGLQDVKGITQAEISSIVEGRPWRSFQDFVNRAEVSRPTVEGLVHCGAFDSLKKKRSRRELYWTVEEGWAERQRERSEQLTLDLSVAEVIMLPGVSDYSDKEKVEAELEILGLDVSNHLISFYLDRLKRLGWTPAGKLREMRSNASVVVAGVKVATQTPPTKSGKRVIFLTLEDGTGQADIALFSEAQAKYARKVFDGWMLAVKGTVRRTGVKGVSILGEEVIDLGERVARPRKLHWSSPGSAGR